jgi:hypothetical protein
VDPAPYKMGAEIDVGQDALDRAPAHGLCDCPIGHFLSKILDRAPSPSI